MNIGNSSKSFVRTTGSYLRISTSPIGGGIEWNGKECLNFGKMWSRKLNKRYTILPQLSVSGADKEWYWTLSYQNGPTIRGGIYSSEAAAWDNGRFFRELQEKAEK